VLDGIRAAESFAPAQLDGVKTHVGMAGYSGGAHATAAANELAPAYAPELDVVGVAAGGVPVANRDMVKYLDGSIGTGAVLAVALAFERAYPSMRLTEVLNEKGLAFKEEYAKGCASAVFAAPFEHLDDFTTVKDAIDLPRIARVIETNQLGHAIPTAPSFYYNGTRDELIYIKPLDALVQKYCDNGARVRYVRDPLGIEHIQAVPLFAPMAVQYLLDRFAGEPVPNTCGPATATAPPPAPCARPVRHKHRAHRRVRSRGAHYRATTRRYLRACR
jgi:triacylglycerol lipase